MCAESVKEKHCRFAFLTIILIAASATVAISVMVSEEAFASDGTSQAAAVDNTCLNPIFDSNEDIDNAIGVGNCGGTVSQQDESGQASAPITSQTANPTLEVQRSTQPPDTETPTTHTCDDCFDMLTATQQEAFEQILAPGGGSPLGTEWPTGITTIEELCEAWAAFSTATKEVAFDDISGILIEIQANDMIDNMVRCLFTSVG